MEYTKVLVTGANGFIGTNLCQYLAREHPEVDVWAFDLRYGQDILNREQVNEAVRGMDLVIHLAASTHIDNSIEQDKVGDTITIETNLIGTANLLWACRQHGVKMIFISSSEVYGTAQEKYLTPAGRMTEEHPLLPNGAGYAASKAGADLLCYASFYTFGQDVVRVRPFNQYGPYQACEKMIPKAIALAVEGRPIPIYGNGSASRDWLYVKDTVKGIWEARNLPAGEVINLATGKDYTLVELVEAIRRVASLYPTNPDCKSIHVTEVMDRPGHVMRLCGDSQRAFDKMNWHPAYTLEQGIEETYLWLVANGKVMPPLMARDVMAKVSR
jgi:dTDP-glucose 4,6-dehydratase